MLADGVAFVLRPSSTGGRSGRRLVARKQLAALAQAHQRPSAQVLQAAAARELAAGSADVRVAYDIIDG
ncbi:hypothetical protein [Streptomyces sp. NPDC093225]|uniref:hypothetical protein n=1 Tax=Streptomyces sp. NPDC093225 TaxID=3366034 RepID=UPI0037F232C7